jgi:hypothetical protein
VRCLAFAQLQLTVSLYEASKTAAFTSHLALAGDTGCAPQQCFPQASLSLRSPRAHWLPGRSAAATSAGCFALLQRGPGRPPPHKLCTCPPCYHAVCGLHLVRIPPRYCFLIGSHTRHMYPLSEQGNTLTTSMPALAAAEVTYHQQHHRQQPKQRGLLLPPLPRPCKPAALGPNAAALHQRRIPHSASHAVPRSSQPAQASDLS